MSKIWILAFSLFTTCATAQQPLPPATVTVTPYERHVSIAWEASPSANVSGYQVYRSDDSVTFTLLKSTGAANRFVVDWTGDEGTNLKRWYQIRTTANGGLTSDFTPAQPAQTFTMNDEQLLDMVQYHTFRYFWDFGHPVSGMARERTGSGETVTSGGTGFGVMAIIAAVERGWITRQQAVGRMLQLVSFLQYADRFHGVFPHWMNGTTGNTIAFSQFDDGGDLVETAFLMQGLLTARAYFDDNNAQESAVRDVITSLWEEVEWDWYRRNNSGVLYWHWSPNHGWQMNFPLRGFYEAQIVYILAAASPTHGVPGSLYQTGWTSSNYANNSIHYGHKIFCGPFGGGPMFFAHYSYLGFDPRYVKDAFCNYFIRNRNHALIQQAYSVANPENHEGYSADCWGLTSCDGPSGYSAHDIRPNNDDGTIAPTAALASMPFTKAESMAAMRHFYRELGENLWGEYGFYDAFNLNQNWFANSCLAIDQGPIVVMIENARTGLFWDLFMKNSEIAPALTALGFQPDNGTVDISTPLEMQGFDAVVFPNPVTSQTIQVEFSVLEAQNLTIQLFSNDYRHLQTLGTDQKYTPGIHQQQFQLPTVPAGTYWLEISGAKGKKTLPVVVKG